MCGIIGYIGGRNAAVEVYEGLKRLEYRGYDSAGAAFCGGDKLTLIKKRGKVEKLLPHLKSVRATIGIGHTRWATHGVPSDVNAHPHSVGNICVVHNGIIENYAELKAGLEAEGSVFLSRTDSEVAAHLLNKYYDGDLLYAMKMTVGKLRGSYALMAVCKGENKIVAACNKSPLIIGYGFGENYCASDEPALAGKCETIVVMEDGDLAEITAESVAVYNCELQSVIREPEPNLAVSADMSTGDCPHYMLKEIREVPESVLSTKRAFSGIADKFKTAVSGAKRIIMTGCGTAYHAALIGKRYFESFASIPVEVETAGEFRYKDPLINEDTVLFAISQSGETADTVEAARLARSRGAKIVAVTNSHRSQLNRIADIVVPVAAGPEICVAATKSYTGQITALYLCALAFAGKDDGGIIEYAAGLCRDVVKNTNVDKLAHMCARSRGTYFMGRDLDYAVALEGSLKLKEISYVPGEGYPAGELKHGTLALIDRRTVSVFVITDKELAGKSGNAVEQVISRGGKVAVVTNVKGLELPQGVSEVITIPECDKFLSPLLSVIVLQYLAYRTAVLLKKDPDKPRNLAKSVTVE